MARRRPSTERRQPKPPPPAKAGILAVQNPYAEMDETKASASFQAFRNANFFLPHFEDDQEPMSRLLKKYGKSSTWVYIAVNRIANAAAQIPLQVMDRTREGQPNQVIRTHDRGLISLLDRPNPFQSRFDFVETAFVSLELTGNLFIELADMDELGRPHGMYVLNPSRMSIVPDPRNYVRGYVYSVNGIDIPFSPREIIHVKYAHSDNDFFGMSPLTAARLAIDVDRAALEWNRTFLLRGGWPVGAIESPNDMDDQNRKRLQRDLKQMVQRGKDAAGLVLLLTGGLKYNKLSVTPKEMDWLDARRMSRDEILAIYGVPFAVAGLFSTEQTTARSAGVTQQVKNFYIFTMFPKIEKFVSALNLGLAPLFADRFQVQADLKGVPALKDDVEQELIRAETFQRLTTSGWSINAALGELYPHVERVPWGDAYWVNKAMIPVKDDEPPPVAAPPVATVQPAGNDGTGGTPPAADNTPAQAAGLLGSESVLRRIRDRVRERLN